MCPVCDPVRSKAWHFPSGTGYTGSMKAFLSRLGQMTGLTIPPRLRRIPSMPKQSFPAAVRLDTPRWREWSEKQSLEMTGPEEAPFFLSPGGELPRVERIWLESALLVAAAENLDAVFFADAARELPPVPPDEFSHLLRDPWRRWTLFSSLTFSTHGDEIRKKDTKKPAIAKIIPPGGLRGDHGAGPADTRTHRGPYLFSSDPGPRAEIQISDPLPLDFPPPADGPPGLLVTAPFLARGGAEQTLFSVLKVLAGEFHIVYATLAEHRPETGDRRKDFRAISPLLYSLGDWVHPDAMESILGYLIEKHQIIHWHNANGTTLFYQFAPGIKERFPGLEISDHLYDHRIGYIEAYEDVGLKECISTVVAENHLIKEEMTTHRTWPEHRVPVIWPCGRPEEELPDEMTQAERRKEIRRQLGISTDTILFLSAIRIHPQKRPLDLPLIAQRAPENCFFLIAGGGPLEEELDRAIVSCGLDTIRRIPFSDDIPGLILAADVGLLVSEFEGLPVFALECLQMGRPFIGTDVGDLGPLLKSTGGGIISGQPGDIGALSAAISEMASREKRETYARSARDARNLISVEECAEKMARVFRGDAR